MANPYFIKIDGIKGECTDTAHEGWIEVKEWNHEVSQNIAGPPSASGGHATQGVNVETFTFTKEMDSSSPTLNQFCCTAANIKSIIVESCRSTGDQAVYCKYEFENAIVASVSVSASGEIPEEEVKIAFTKIKWNYTPITQDGKKSPTITKTWNLVTNRET